MSENEKFTAEVTETVAESVTEQDIELATPQESNPLENESAEISEKETEKSETAEEVEKETTDEENTQNEVHSKKKIGAVIAACAVLALSLSTIGMFGLSNRGAQATVDTTDTTASDSKTNATVVTDEVAKGENSAVVGTISWWKAGVEEYDFINIDEDMMATTTTTTTTTTVTTTPAPETTTTAPETTTTVTTTTPPPTTTTVTTTEKKPEYTEEEIEKVTFYLTTNVNLRKGPGTSFDKITTLKKDTAVTAFAKVSNGWYKVKFGDMTGYIIDDYLTKTKPVTTTTTTTTTTTKPADTAAPDEEGTPSTEPVVSYTEEELEMFYYVVEGEVGGCSEESKLAVANVIINRVQSPRFANTLKGVMTAKSQFTAISNYYSKKRTPTESTIDCVNRALYGEDNSNGAVYFYSAKYCSASTIAWFESLTFCLEIDGQRYFK